MAVTTIHTPAPTLGLGARIGETFAMLIQRIADASEGARAARHAGALARLTDDQLAARGLTRDQIVAHAFEHLIPRTA